MPNPKNLRDDYQHSQFYIGAVAQLTGATRKAIRHYETLGLIPAPLRRGKYRVYTGRHVFAVHVIKHSQAYGFSLAELQELMHAINHQPDFPLQDALASVTRKRDAVRQQVAQLRQLDHRLGLLLQDIKKYFS